MGHFQTYLWQSPGETVQLEVTVVDTTTNRNRARAGVPLFTICQWDSVAGPGPGGGPQCLETIRAGADQGNRASV